MKQRIARIAVAVGLGVGALGVAVPAASAINVSVQNGQSCTATGTKGANWTSVTADTCPQVRARSKHNTDGTQMTFYGSWSTATSTASGAGSRYASALNVAWNGATTGWLSF